MTKVIPVNHWSTSVFKTGSFHPVGKIALVYPGKGELVYNPHRNPQGWGSEAPVIGARMFVGFNVGGKPTWGMNNLIPIVKSVRKKQTGSADASLLYQKGLYTHKTSGETVTEDGAQIIILNLSDKVSIEEFKRQMVELGEVICRELQQEEVVAEIQKGGMVTYTMGINA